MRSCHCRHVRGHGKQLLVSLLALMISIVGLTDRASADDIIYVVRRGWHVDIGFAADQLVPPLSGLEAPLPGLAYLLVGFGDRQYLIARRHGLPAMWGALWPGRGLILATGLAATPGAAFGQAHVIALKVTDSQERAAQDFVWKSLTPSATTGAPPPLADPGPYPGSEYYAAVPRYSAVHTCNTWAAEVLHQAGLPIRSRGVIFAGQLWKQARRLDRFR